MGEHTNIEWCHHTFNPWRGCTQVSPGCDHCYAEAWSKRNPAQLGTWGDDGERVIAGDSYWRTPLRWDSLAAEAGERRRVFCASLADVFEDRPELEGPRERLFALIYDTPNLDWLLLTKRPANAKRMLEALLWREESLAWPGGGDFYWPPPPNLWLGVTAEDHERADERIPVLLDTPAAIRFVSYEPAIGPVDWWEVALAQGFTQDDIGDGVTYPRRVDWIIVGGESGPHARPFDLAWARDAIAQGHAAGAAVFVKQLGARPFVSPEHDGATGYELSLASRKGGDVDEWPEDLRVREIPTPVRVVA